MSSRRNMRKHQREVWREARRIAAAHGGSVQFIAGNPHCKIICRCRGKERMTPIACTPRDMGGWLRMKLRDLNQIFQDLAQ